MWSVFSLLTEGDRLEQELVNTFLACHVPDEIVSVNIAWQWDRYCVVSRGQQMLQMSLKRNACDAREQSVNKVSRWLNCSLSVTTSFEVISIFVFQRWPSDAILEFIIPQIAPFNPLKHTEGNKTTTNLSYSCLH